MIRSTRAGTMCKFKRIPFASLQSVGGFRGPARVQACDLRHVGIRAIVDGRERHGEDVLVTIANLA